MAREDKAIKCKVYLTSRKSTNNPLAITAFIIDVPIQNGVAVDSTGTGYLFDRFKEQVRQAFPEKTLAEYKIYHIDDEHDFVSIASVKSFLAAMVRDKEKFCVVIPAPNQNNDDSDDNSNVKCDGCGVKKKNIKGGFYECVEYSECNNFNLCPGCEKKGIHPHHTMIHLRDPDTTL